MDINPVSELKRRLEDDSAPLPKRLCLARNVASTRYLPTVAKERALTDWLRTLNPGDEAARSVLEWRAEVIGAELQGSVVEFLAKYLEKNTAEPDIAEKIVNLLENDKILPQLTSQSDHFLLVTRMLLKQYLEVDPKDSVALCERLLQNIVKVYKTSTRKVDFIIKILKGETLEVIFDYLNVPELRDSCLNLCQTVLFPAVKKSHFITFLQTLIRKESIDQLLEEKGDNIRSVLKIMSTFFTFPEGRTTKDERFLCNYIDAFVSSFKSDSNLIFAFFVMIINSLNIQQTYLNPTMTMPIIHFEEHDDKIKRYIMFKALECLKENDIDLNVRLTETIGEKLTKVEIKKNFTSFLQASIMNALKLEGKPDKVSLKIVTLALRLDPNLIEPKMDKILPNIMTSKKNNASVLEAYTEMINCLFETLFKLSRGTEFFSQMLPLVKLQLEAVNTEQFEMKQQLDDERLMSKLIVGEDLLPKTCVERYGQLTSELTLKQNGELFVSLQKEFETHCLILLSEGFVSPSLITLSEMLASILSSVLVHSKMADHTVTLHIAHEFWANFETFETEFLSKFGECLLNLSFNSQLTASFLQICLSYCKLKLLHARYGNVKVDNFSLGNAGNIFDFSLLLPCLSTEQWVSVASRVQENQDVGCMESLNHLQLLKVLVCDLYSSDSNAKELDKYKHDIKSHLVKELNSVWNLIDSCPYYAQVLFNNLETSTEQSLSKSLIKMLESEPRSESVLRNEAVSNNKTLLTSLVLETLKTILRVVEDETFLKINKSIRKAIKGGFEFEEIIKGCDVPMLFEKLTDCSNSESEHNMESIFHNLDVLKSLQIPCLDENCQLLSIFVILVLKRIFSNSKSSKKISRSTDHLLLNIFELAPKNPDLFKVFPIDFMFSFKDNLFLNLITLNKLKTSNRSIIIKAILETAVKKVKTDNEVIKTVVKILLSNQKIKKNHDSSINYFSNEVFQTTCMILPIIAKEKKAITTSAYRSILAELQEKLHQSLLKSFKNVDFGLEKSLFLNKTVDPEDSMTVEMSESTLATLNAVDAYTLTLSKYCECTNEEDSGKMDCLLECLEYFVGNGIAAIQNAESKTQHVDASIQLLNIVLRNFRKLATHEIFKEKDQLFLRIWQSLKCRLLSMFCTNDKRNSHCFDEIAVTVKYLCELCSVGFFTTRLSMDLSHLMALKCTILVALLTPIERDYSVMAPPSLSSKTTPNYVLTSHRVARYLWSSILKANVTGPKSASLSKCMYRTTKTLIHWLKANYDEKTKVDDSMMDRGDMMDDKQFDDEETAVVKLDVDDEVCEVLRCDLDCLSEAITNAKKISLNHRFLDAVFELQHCVHRVLGAETSLLVLETSWSGFLAVSNGAVSVLNGLLQHREELLEDRWPCYLQCYRGLVACLCRRATSDLQLDRVLEEGLAETAHTIEKLTQAICKRRSQVSRLAAYLVADICSALERFAPCRPLRQHLENCVALLIQASESTYAAAFLRRALAGSPGHMTMTNLYSMYKRYHKYVGTS